VDAQRGLGAALHLLSLPLNASGAPQRNPPREFLLKFIMWWCPEPGSNRHATFAARDFKSRVSTNFTIGARSLPF
jgi:hypothetical protein